MDFYVIFVWCHQSKMKPSGNFFMYMEKMFGEILST